MQFLFALPAMEGSKISIFPSDQAPGPACLSRGILGVSHAFSWCQTLGLPAQSKFFWKHTFVLGPEIELSRLNATSGLPSLLTNPRFGGQRLVMLPPHRNPPWLFPTDGRGRWDIELFFWHFFLLFRESPNWNSHTREGPNEALFGVADTLWAFLSQYCPRHWGLSRWMCCGWAAGRGPTKPQNFGLNFFWGGGWPFPNQRPPNLPLTTAPQLGGGMLPCFHTPVHWTRSSNPSLGI